MAKRKNRWKSKPQDERTYYVVRVNEAEKALIKNLTADGSPRREAFERLVPIVQGMKELKPPKQSAMRLHVPNALLSALADKSQSLGRPMTEILFAAAAIYNDTLKTPE